MDIQELTDKINSFDINDIDWNNMGSWPLVGRVAFAIILFVGVLVGSYFLDISDISTKLSASASNEAKLKKEFERKAFRVANLDAYKQQLVDIEDSFGTLLRQLPRDTEVPGLLEDITGAALGAGLTINSIKLKDEVETEYYTELPIDIDVNGEYHDFGAFVSAVAALSRIVTLHDFSITQMKKGNSALLNLKIVAKTYRYSNGDDQNANKRNK